MTTEPEKSLYFTWPAHRTSKLGHSSRYATLAGAIEEYRMRDVLPITIEDFDGTIYAAKADILQGIRRALKCVRSGVALPETFRELLKEVTYQDSPYR